MTGMGRFRRRYWNILAPQLQFPPPRFHFGQKVGCHWYDDTGTPNYDIGVIIGMQYGASGYNRPEWCYLLRMLKCDSSPWILGSDDGEFNYESSLVAEDTGMNW